MPLADWPVVAVPPRLDDDSIHVWSAALDAGEAFLRRCQAWLSADEVERQVRLRNADQRGHFAITHGTLRFLLGSYLEIDPAAITFTKSPLGKPALASPPVDPPLNFNLSHSGWLALLAFARGAALGIDVEDCSRRVDDQQLAGRFFASSEVAVLAQLPAGDRRSAFFRTWVCKEAYLKAVGSGLTHSLARVEVSLGPGKPARLAGDASDPTAAERWRLYEIDPGEGYIAALAAPRGEWQVRCFQLETG